MYNETWDDAEATFYHEYSHMEPRVQSISGRGLGEQVDSPNEQAAIKEGYEIQARVKEGKSLCER